jgi:hypothetical protein
VTRATFLAASAGVLVGGGLAGWATGERPALVVKRDPGPPGLAEVGERWEGIADRAACTAAVAAGLAEIEALRREAYGDPEPFPDDVDPAYLPAAVEARARSVSSACPELGLQLLKVDCAEFPCVTVWNRTSDADWNDLARLDTCGVWSSVERDDRSGTSVGGMWKGPNGEDISVSMVATYPPGWHETHPPPVRDPELRKPRFEVRKEWIFGDIQAELGARDMTKVEQLEWMVEAVRESEQDEETVQFWVDQLEEARAAEAAEAVP